MPKTTPQTKLSYRLRRSPVHGTGLFATQVIRKGAGVIEYIGERISHEEADRRHAEKDADDGHTFLFTVDSKTVIDAGVGGNAARFINHSCEGNCEVINDKGRLFVETLRTIKPGEELNYDYNIGRTPEDPPNVNEISPAAAVRRRAEATCSRPSASRRCRKEEGRREEEGRPGKAKEDRRPPQVEERQQEVEARCAKTLGVGSSPHFFTRR